MPSLGDLVPIAEASAFIFSGSIAFPRSPTAPILSVDAPTVVVSVDDVIKAPPGLRGFAGSDVTVRLLHPLAAGRYVFFADPLVVGGGIAVSERAHLDASRSAVERVAAAVQQSHKDLIARRLDAATLVALGTLGEVRSLIEGSERPRGVPWAEAPLEIETVAKGSAKNGRVVVVGPRYGSRHLPSAPPLRPGLHALFFLTSPPHEAMERLNPADRHSVFFIATSADIQPPEHLEAIERVPGGKPKK